MVTLRRPPVLITQRNDRMRYPAFMRMPIAQIEWSGNRVQGIKPDHVIAAIPEPGWPNGRAAAGRAEVWRQLAEQGCEGVIWLDPDIAADPDDLDALAQFVALHPADVVTATVKLWPASTGRATWMYGHRWSEAVDDLDGQTWHQRPRYWTTSMVWTPAQLLDLAMPEMPDRPWHGFDVWLNRLALAHDIPAWAVPDCQPKHLHF